MKKKHVKPIGRLALLLGLALFFVQCETDLNTVDQPATANAAVTLRDAGRGAGISVAELCACLETTFPKAALSEAEINALLFMREEEKMARDVYGNLFGKYASPVFDHIRQAEQRHMDAVKCLIDKYGLTDPVGDNAPGIFRNPTLQQQYTALVKSGSESLAAALTAGATIEETDLNDLALRGADTDNDDIAAVFKELAKGSRNHLRAFVFQLENIGVSYEPGTLDAAAFTAIVTSEKETGGSICGVCLNNSPQGNRGVCDGTGQGLGKGMRKNTGPANAPTQPQKRRGRN